MSGRTVRRAGDLGLLAELDVNADVHRLAAGARERWGSALEELVPGHTTLLLIWRADGIDIDAARFELESLPLADPAQSDKASEVRIQVRYDGPDLEEVAAAAGVEPSEVARLHSAREYHAAFIGFAPGFAYLIGGEPRLDLPRRNEPRVRVEAGSVAIAAGYSAIYPFAGPGGWHIIGRTEERMFDPTRSQPALIEPGARVIFEPV